VQPYDGSAAAVVGVTQMPGGYVLTSAIGLAEQSQQP
jgi:hypothetical protein